MKEPVLKIVKVAFVRVRQVLDVRVVIVVAAGVPVELDVDVGIILVARCVGVTVNKLAPRFIDKCLNIMIVALGFTVSHCTNIVIVRPGLLGRRGVRHVLGFAIVDWRRRRALSRRFITTTLLTDWPSEVAGDRCRAFYRLARD